MRHTSYEEKKLGGTSFFKARSPWTNVSEAGKEQGQRFRFLLLRLLDEGYSLVGPRLCADPYRQRFALHNSGAA